MSRRDSGRKAHQQAEKASRDNRSRQMNPNNDAYWRSRGESERPTDWQGQSMQDAGNKSER